MGQCQSVVTVHEKVAGDVVDGHYVCVIMTGFEKVGRAVRVGRITGILTNKPISVFL